MALKTQFSALLKLRKNDLDNAERKVIACEGRLVLQQKVINDLRAQFLALEAPKEGTFHTFNIFSNAKHIITNQINEANIELESIKAHKAQLQEHYKKCHIEYEKIKFLQKQVQDKLLAKAKRKEQLESNEIALMLYNSNTLGNNTLGGRVI